MRKTFNRNKAARIFWRLSVLAGTFGLMVAPFWIDTETGKLAIVASLLVLSVQMMRLKAWNMVLANTVSIAGYMWSLFA